MVKKSAIFAVIASILLLLWLWPNLVHEPLHYAAVVAFGGNGVIFFDWSFPSTPYIGYEGLVPWQEVIMHYTPNAVFLLLLLIIFLTPRWNLFTDVSLPIY